jgi:LPXTG-motif cell wall-anchored protein
MRKIANIGAAVGSMLLTLALTALPAVAQNYPPPPPAPTEVPQGGQVAFTGTDVTLLAVLMGVLLIVGVSALMIARRRSSAAAG